MKYKFYYVHGGMNANGGEDERCRLDRFHRPLTMCRGALGINDGGPSLK